MNTINMDLVAKTHLGIGRNKLFRILREQRILMNVPGRRNIPYQKYIDQGYFRIIQEQFKRNDINNYYYKTVVTEKGIKFLKSLMGEIC